MESMTSRRNDPPFKTSSSYGIARRTDNSLRRQSSAMASSSSYKVGYSPHRTSYNTRQSLSKSYDSPDGIRGMSPASAKKVSSPLRRAASPPAISPTRGQHISRNQTILDDAAWMSERLNNLQKTGFLRYPSISRLRDPGDNSPSLDSFPGSYKDHEGMSRSSPSCLNQSSSLQHSQTVINQADEPLSAFRLSEVTLSEEDLLTDISSCREVSTCSSTPVSLQSGRNFDQIASEFYQGTSLSHNSGKAYHKYVHQSNVSPNGSVKLPNSAASGSSECTTSNLREDLLLRLEALQYRAELAAKEGNDSHSSNHDPKHDSKQFWNGQVSHRDQDTLPANQKRGACAQQSNAGSAASPTHSNLSTDSVSWPEEPEKSLDSTCWLKDINEDLKGEPCISHLIHSSSRNIRPEYYLPLSREEEPVCEAGVGLFSSPKGGKLTDPRNDNIRRLALGGLSPMRQRRSEEIRPGKSVSNQYKQTSLARKSRRALESSMDSVDGPVKTCGMSSPSSSKSSPVTVRRTLPRASQNLICAEHKGFTNLIQEETNNITPSFEMEASALEGDDQTRNSLENRLEYDGESSWISEENVEGFLRSWSFTVDALSTPNEYSSPVHCTSRISSSLSSERSSRNKNIEKLDMKHCGSMASIPIFDHCKESPGSYQGGSTNQTGTHLQLLEAGSLGDSPSLLEGTYQDHMFHQSVCQIFHSGDESLNYDSMACCKDNLHNKEARGSHNDAGIREQVLPVEDPVRRSAAPQRDLNTVNEGSVENKVTLEAQGVALESKQKLESTDIGPSLPGRCTFHTSIPLNSKEQHYPLSMDALSSPPEDLLVEDRHWPVVANRNETAAHRDKIHSQSLLAGGSAEHKIFARIVRSLSFSGQEKSELKSSSKSQKHRDLSEPKSTSFSHYWIPNSAYSDSRRTEEENLQHHNFAETPNGLELQQTSALTEEELLKEIPSLSDRSEISDMDRRHKGNGASLILLDNTCRSTSKIEQRGMAHTILAAGTISNDCGASVNSEAPLRSMNSSQQCYDLDLDNPIETLCKAQEDPRSASVRKENSSCQQLQKSSRVPNVGKTAVDDKGYHRHSGTKFTVEDLGTIILPTYKNDPADAEPEVVVEALTISEQHASFDNQKNGLVLEDATKDETISKIPCSSGSKNGGTGETSTAETSSLLSIYKNPLWLDEVNLDFENHHGSQNQEFLGLSYPDERNTGFLDSDKNKIGFSKRSLGEVWDTYEGMGGFTGPFPSSPPCVKGRVSGANHILVGFDNPLNSSDSNSLALNSVWDVESSAGKKLRKMGEEVEDGHVTVCEPRFSESFSNFEGPETMKSQIISHDTFSSSSVKVRDIPGMIDEKRKINAHLVRLDAISHLQDSSTAQTKSSSNSAKEPDGPENCLREQSIWPYDAFPMNPSHCTKLTNSNVTIQDTALVAKESTLNDIFSNAEPECGSSQKRMLLREGASQTHDAKAGSKGQDKLDHNGIKTRKELSRQKSGASINIERTSDGKMQSDQRCELHSKESFEPLDCKFGFVSTTYSNQETVNASEENHSAKGPVMKSNAALDDGEEVKQVTFIYSDSKEPQKDSQAVQASLPEVPLEVLSTWVLSFFSHATKGGGNFKKKDPNQLLIQDNTREDQAELNKIGKKVEALEAEIDRFKQENRKLQNLMKCMIRKMKQLQQGFQGRKRHGSSRGFMTCIYSVRVKRSRSKTLRKS
eukprot:c25132_g1_i1 orf=765-5870(-)